MGKSKKTTGKHRLDRFYYLAKEQGYRSRAAFKLVQLDRKYRFLSSARSLLDLCAAPGGWMQVAAKNMPVGGLLIGVDLVPIKPIRGAVSLQGDITAPKCMAAIRSLLKEKGHTMIDVVLHDGSPNVGGAWAKEASSQTALVLDALKLATKLLAPKGTFVTKVFRSQDYNSLLYAFKQLFEKVEVTKPVASRNTSAEIYVICSKYRAPAKIDPRLLDSRHLFQEISEPQKVVDVLKGSKQKRHREGYEEGNYTLTKESQASNFVWADKPLDILGTITSISFSAPESSSIKDHPLTTEEIQLLCEDLRVLGKQEFKQLLKWRLRVRKDLSAVKETDSTDNQGTEEPTQNDKEESLLNEMGDLKELMDAKKKKARKVLAKRRQKAKARSATGMQVDVMEDKYMDAELFDLSSIKAKKALDQVEDASEEEFETKQDDILNGRAPFRSDNEDESDMDSDTERQRYDAELEEYLDRAYHRYQAVKGGSAKKRKRAKLIDAEKETELWEGNSQCEMNAKERQEEKTDIEKIEENPLLIQFDQVKPSKEQVTKQWFSQEIFAGFEDINENSDEEDNHAEQKEEVDPLCDKSVPFVNPTSAQIRKDDISPQADADGVHREQGSKMTDDFEVVPAESSSSSDASSDEDYDSDAKAETLAYAKRMLRKKNREEIIDAAYNRYTFDDEALPDWFADDERKHSQPQKPVTKEEILAMKAQFRAINARPAKKVAEAKARKKRRAMKKMEQVRKKATAIADQSDISAHSKNRMMERLYSKAANSDRVKRVLVVAKKGVNVRGGKGKVIVDRRMKKDNRSRGMKIGTGKKGKKISGKRPKPAKSQGKSGFKGTKRKGK